MATLVLDAAELECAAFGPFVLLRRLGAGGMAETYLAERRARLSQAEGAAFGRAVCLKLILPEHLQDPNFRGWFLDEARIHAQLHHDNIVQVYDFGELEGRTYLVLEYVEGCDLRALLEWLRLEDQRLPTPLVVALALELAAALDYAHRLVIDGVPQRLVHRDVSPHNILLSLHGHAKLCDFGVVKAHSREMRTETGGTKGKVPYMSPEQLTDPARVDARSDLFALGVVLFELLTGQHPFRVTGFETDMEVARRIFAGTRARVAALRPDLSPELAAVVEELLENDMDRRMPSATQLIRRLEALPVTLSAATARSVAKYVRAASVAGATLPTVAAVEPNSDVPVRRGWQPGTHAITALALALALGTAVGAASLLKLQPRALPRRALPVPVLLPAVELVAEPPVAPVRQVEHSATAPPVRERRSSSRALVAESPQPLDAWLDIDVGPDGRTWLVWVDGQYQGTADVKVKVAAGKHQVAVGLEAPTKERVVRVSSQSRRSIHFKVR